MYRNARQCVAVCCHVSQCVVMCHTCVELCRNVCNVSYCVVMCRNVSYLYQTVLQCVGYVSNCVLVWQYGHLAVVRYLVEDCTVNVDTAREDGATPLFMAANNNHLEVNHALTTCANHTLCLAVSLLALLTISLSRSLSQSPALISPFLTS